MAKSKRKAAAGEPQQAGAEDGPSTSGRPYTVTMAVSSSSIDNTQNIEFATFVAGQVRLKEVEGGGGLVLAQETGGQSRMAAVKPSLGHPLAGCFIRHVRMLPRHCPAGNTFTSV
jgi:hypothetical protein